MAVELPLSDYAHELTKRGYLEKILGIKKQYLIPVSELMKSENPPVTNNDIFNCLVLGHKFCTSQ